MIKSKIFITRVQIEQMYRALGGKVTPARKDMGWRNEYYAPDFDYVWEDLVTKGLATRYRALSGAYIYQVSKKGLEILGVTFK